MNTDRNLVNLGILKGRIEREVRDLSEEIRRCAVVHDQGSARLAFERISNLLEVHREIGYILGDSLKSLYVFGSMFLTECHKELMKSTDEDMIILTGMDFGGIKVVDTIIKLDLSQRSRVFVRADDKSLAEVLYRIDSFGHTLMAWFHSHPWNGIASVWPSARDLETQERLEKGRYPVIGGIFSKDGYVGFFSKTNPFNVWVYGDLVEQKDETTIFLRKAGKD